MQQTKQLAFADDLDDDLLTYMAMGTDDPNDARQAGAVFYGRHKGFLFALLKKKEFGRLIGGDEGVADLVQHTFMKVFEGAGTYIPSGSLNAVSQRRAARNWVVGIARNIYRDATLRHISIVADPSLDEDIDTYAEVVVPPDQESKAVRVVAAEVNAMTEREQDIIRTTMLHFKPGEPHQRLPNDISKSLASQWCTTPQNIRAIRKRCYDKIRRAVENHFASSRARSR